MANNWTAVENSFPTFEEGESPYVQIKKLQDYMRQLTDQLKYSLSNISADNWNSSSLESFSAGLTGDYIKQLQEYAQQVARLNGTVSGYTAELKSVNAKLEKLLQMEDAVSSLGTYFTEVQNTAAEIQAALSPLFAVVVPSAGGVDLQGIVTINGKEIT